MPCPALGGKPVLWRAPSIPAPQAPPSRPTHTTVKGDMVPYEDDEHDVDSYDENRERQDAEFEMISAAYSPEEAWAIVDGDGTNEGTDAPALRKLCRRLELPTVGAITNHNGNSCNNSSGSIPLELVLTLPRAYPTDEGALLAVDASLGTTAAAASGHRKAALDALPHLLQVCRAAAFQSAGSEAVFGVLARAEVWIGEDWPSLCRGGGGEAPPAATCSHSQSQSHTGTTGTTNSTGEITPNTTTTLGRLLIYSHHIIAKSKRRAIKDLAREHNLGGYAKIGWPGIIVVEGPETDCEAFYAAIRRFRWQHLELRGREVEALDAAIGNASTVAASTTLDDLRRFPTTMTELGEDQMSLLAELCAEAGLEDLFRTSMKIYNTEEGGDDTAGETSMAVKANETVPRYGTLVLVDHMNDSKGYTKWLHKACKSVGCSCLIKHCFPGDNRNTKRKSKPLILVGLIGDEESSIQQVLKRWRTSRVDVDSRGNPCLERMMTVLVETRALDGENDDALLSSLGSGGGNEQATVDELESLVRTLGGASWAESFRDLTGNRRQHGS